MIGPDAIRPSKQAAPALAFLRTGANIWYESWSRPKSIRRYIVGKAIINVETISQMSRTIRLWKREDGGLY